MLYIHTFNFKDRGCMRVFKRKKKEKMSQQRGLSRDRILFRILKTKSPAVNNICEKLVFINE